MTKKNSFKYILRLLAGKFGSICTEFPQTRFSAKNSKWLPLKFSAKKYVNITSCKNFNDIIYEQSFVQISLRILLFKETKFSSKDPFVVSQAFYAQGDVKISTLATWQAKFNLLVPCQLVSVVVPISIFLNFLKLVMLLLTRPLSAVHFFSCTGQF